MALSILPFLIKPLLHKSPEPHNPNQRTPIKHTEPSPIPPPISLPIPSIQIHPPPSSPTPPYPPNLDHEASRPNTLTLTRKPRFSKQHLRPLPTAALNIKPRTKAYRKLHRQQKAQKAVEVGRKMEERVRRRGEREMRAEVVGERAYYRLYEAKGGVVYYVERRRKRGVS